MNQVKKDVAGAAKKFDAAANPARKKILFRRRKRAKPQGFESRTGSDARHAAVSRAGASESRRRAQHWIERLAALPQLKRQLENAERGGQSLGQNELK